MTAADVANAITSTASPATGLAAIAQPVGTFDGVVLSLQPGLPFNTVTVSAVGDPTPIPGVRYASSYSPAVGDTVTFMHVGNMITILFAPSGGTGSSGGGVDIGDCIWTPVQKTSNPNWLLCDTRAVDPVLYPALHAINANTPDLMHYLPAGTGLVTAGTTAGAATHTMAAGDLVAHTHTGAAHAHSHSHAGPSHNHGYDQQVVGGGYGAGAYTAAYTSSHVGTDSAGTGATSTDATTTTPGAGGSTGSGTAFSILNPVRGGYWYQRAL
jgi:hypothetical protein